MKLDQSPPALRKALQHLPLPTVQEALASMGDVGDLIGGCLHPATPASIEAQPAVPLGRASTARSSVSTTMNAPCGTPPGGTDLGRQSGCNHTARRTAGCRRRSALGACEGQGGPSRGGWCAT